MKWLLDMCRENSAHKNVIIEISTSMGDVEMSYYNPYSASDVAANDVDDLLAAINGDCDFYNGIIGSVKFI